MTNLSPIEHQITFFYTSNLAETAHFYEKILGLPLVLDQGSCRIYRTSSNAAIGFCQKSSVVLVTESVILTLITQDVDAWYQHLIHQEVLFDAPPHENSDYRIYHCFLRDPNGYRIEIQRFLHAF